MEVYPILFKGPCTVGQWVMLSDTKDIIMMCYRFKDPGTPVIERLFFDEFATFQFWIDHNDISNRIMLGLELFATINLVIQMTSLRMELPNVSYFTYLDIWMTGCLFFVFGSLCEMAVIHLITVSTFCWSRS